MVEVGARRPGGRQKAAAASPDAALAHDEAGTAAVHRMSLASSVSAQVYNSDTVPRKSGPRHGSRGTGEVLPGPLGATEEATAILAPAGDSGGGRGVPPGA